MTIMPAIGAGTGSLPMQLAAQQVAMRDVAMIGAADSTNQAEFQSMLQKWFVAGRNAQLGWIQALSV